MSCKPAWSWAAGKGAVCAGGPSVCLRFVCLCRRGKVDAFGKTSYQGQEKVGESVLCAGIAAGHGIIANVRGGSHWVLLVSAS